METSQEAYGRELLNVNRKRKDIEDDCQEQQEVGEENKKIKEEEKEYDHDHEGEDNFKSSQEKQTLEHGVVEALRKSEEERGQLKKKVEALRRRINSQLDGHGQVMRTLKQSIGLKEEEHEQEVEALMRDLNDQELFLTKIFDSFI